MSEARNIKEITQKELQDHLKKLVRVYELEMERAKAIKEALQSLLFELDGYKIVEGEK